MVASVTRLHRVLKKIKNPDGSSHQRAYYVKQAEPGDVYAQRRPSDLGKRLPVVNTDMPEETETNDAPYNTDELEQKYSHRITVEPLILPWALADEVGEAEPDPIPKELRKRFDPNNRAIRAKDPIEINIPLFTIRPGEDLLWNGPEQDLLNRLRNGMIVSIRPSAADSHPCYVKIESPDGTVERAYIHFEGMNNERIYDLYGDMYDLWSSSGVLSRRAATAYEVAKAAGFDDIVPPTVYRVNEHDGLEPILSVEATEILADAIGVPKDVIPGMIGNSAALELWTEGSSCLCQHPEFANVMSEPGLINNFYAAVPSLKPALLRAAVYDFLIWNGSRTWMDIMVTTDARHSIILTRNCLALPNPVAMGAAFLDYQSQYASGSPTTIQYMPMLWSDPMIMAALRGYEDEASMFDEIAYQTAKRAQGERIVDLIRTLNDHQISNIAISGLLVRLAFLRFGGRQIMRNPLLVAQYFSSLMTGDNFEPGFDIDLDDMVESINTAMQSAIRYDFDFIKELQGQDDDSGS